MANVLSLQKTCFQTTYEELKLEVTGNGDATYTGFQTTYEELKPS